MYSKHAWQIFFRLLFFRLSSYSLVNNRRQRRPSYRSIRRIPARTKYEDHEDQETRENQRKKTTKNLCQSPKYMKSIIWHIYHSIRFLQNRHNYYRKRPFIIWAGLIHLILRILRKLRSQENLKPFLNVCRNARWLKFW
jgi:hypothetical protein